MYKPQSKVNGALIRKISMIKLAVSNFNDIGFFNINKYKFLLINIMCYY